MAITRRQFVTTLAALAGAMGVSQASLEQLTGAFANVSPSLGGTNGKPRVVWIHGAECTGCSTSVLSFLEDLDGKAIHGAATTTAQALTAAGMGALSIGGGTRTAVYGAGASENAGTGMANIADVVIDLIDLQYHETIMGMGGDLAAKWLDDFATKNTLGFVLVVEGAVQRAAGTGAWTETNTTVPWCSIGCSDNFVRGVSGFENDFADLVKRLAHQTSCKAVVPIGQCATYGGYPGCKAQTTTANAGFDVTKSQTDAMGVYDFLATYSAGDEAKVYNVPGCPVNPWWVGLTVVMLMMYLQGASVDLTQDYGQRIKAVYPITVHSAYCPHYGDYNNGVYALTPGDHGCLQKLGCKGIASNALCGIHGWNNQQPENTPSLASGGIGGHCPTAGAPCMGCTEKGYPDSFVPFVKR